LSQDSNVDLETLVARDRLLRTVREYFHRSDAMEVTTPTLGRTGVTDPHLQNLTTVSAQERWFLQTSPEYAMKRLLAQHAHAMFQICQAYRGGESGLRHNPEFTMLEWYRPGFSLTDLMSDIESLLTTLFDALNGESVVFSRIPYAQCFAQHLGADPHSISDADLQRLARTHCDCQHIGEHWDSGSRADYLDVLFSTKVEPQLPSYALVYDYPVCQAALAKLDLKGSVAQRFEVFLNGVEIANGYDELRDAKELRDRFKANNLLREERGLEFIPIDERLLMALPSMPECSGIALGLDRLLMLVLGKTSLDEVITFTSQSI